jgi:hypothetical protein
MPVSDLFLGLGVLCALWASFVAGLRPLETGPVLAVPTVLGFGFLIAFVVLA